MSDKNSLGYENKPEASKKSSKMKYVFLTITVVLFFAGGLTLINIPLQFIVIKEIPSVIIVGFSVLFGFLSYNFYKNSDTKQSEPEVQKATDQVEIINENKPKDKDITQEQIVIECLKEKDVNVIEQIGNFEILGGKTNKEGSSEYKIIMQGNNNKDSKNTEDEKLSKLLKKLEDNGLTVTYDSESAEWKVERPENVFEQVDEIEISAKEKAENINEQIDEIEIQAVEKAENITQQVDEIEISAKERPENEIEYINEIKLDELDVTQRDDLKIQKVEDKFQIVAAENIVEQIDEIELIEKGRPENVEEQVDEIELTALEKPEPKMEIVQNGKIKIILKQEKKNNENKQKLK